MAGCCGGCARVCIAALRRKIWFRTPLCVCCWPPAPFIIYVILQHHAAPFSGCGVYGLMRPRQHKGQNGQDKHHGPEQQHHALTPITQQLGTRRQSCIQRTAARGGIGLYSQFSDSAQDRFHAYGCSFMTRILRAPGHELGLSLFGELFGIRQEHNPLGRLSLYFLAGHGAQAGIKV